MVRPKNDPPKRAKQKPKEAKGDEEENLVKVTGEKGAPSHTRHFLAILPNPTKQ